MPTWTRFLFAALLVPVAVLSLIPLAFSAYRLSRLGPGDDTRYGVLVERDSGGTLTDDERREAADVLRARLAQADFVDPVVEPSDAPGETVAVTVPPSTDPERAKRLLRMRGRLELRPVVGDSRLARYATPQEAKASPAFDPAEDEVLPFVERDDPAASDVPTRYLMVERAVVTGDDLRDASAVVDQYVSTNYEISFSLKPAGAEKFGTWTKAHVGDDLAIVLDGEIRSAPRIQSEIRDRGQITGKFTKERAEDLAITLRSGRLPGPTTIVSETQLASSRVRSTYRTIAATSALVLVAAIAGVILFLWSAFRRSATER